MKGEERERKKNNSPGTVWEVETSLQLYFAASCGCPPAQTSASMTSEYRTERGWVGGRRVEDDGGRASAAAAVISVPDTCLNSGYKQSICSLQPSSLLFSPHTGRTHIPEVLLPKHDIKVDDVRRDKKKEAETWEVKAAALPAERDSGQPGTQSTLAGWKRGTILTHSPPASQERWLGPPHPLFLSASCALSLSFSLSLSSFCHSWAPPRFTLPPLSLSLSSGLGCVQPDAAWWVFASHCHLCCKVKIPLHLVPFRDRHNTEAWESAAGFRFIPVTGSFLPGWRYGN